MFSRIVTAILLGGCLLIPAAKAQQNNGFYTQLKYANEKISEHRYDLAIGTLEDLKRQAPSEAELAKVEMLQALAYKQRGDFTKANEAITSSMQRTNSVNYLTAFLAGEINEGLGNTSAAGRYYTIAAQLPGNTGLAQEALKRVTQLTSERTVHRIEVIGAWDRKRMPLRIYIDDGAGSPGYSPALKQDAIASFQAWEKASNGSVRFVFVEDKSHEGTDVRQEWSAGKLDPGRDIHLHWRSMLPFKDKEPLGVTYPYVQKVDGQLRIAYSDIYIATNERANGTTYGARAVMTKEEMENHVHQLQFVLMHEVGHALGLGHSQRRSAIMTPTVFGALASDMARKPVLTEWDEFDIVQLYSRARQQSAQASQNASYSMQRQPASAAPPGRRTR